MVKIENEHKTLKCQRRKINLLTANNNSIHTRVWDNIFQGAQWQLHRSLEFSNTDIDVHLFSQYLETVPHQAVPSPC